MNARIIKCVIHRINKSLYYYWNYTELNPNRNSHTWDRETASACNCEANDVKKIKDLL